MPKYKHIEEDNTKKKYCHYCSRPFHPLDKEDFCNNICQWLYEEYQDVLWLEEFERRNNS